MISYEKHYSPFTAVGKNESGEQFLITSREFINENIFV